MASTKMPRSLIAPADEINDCVDINGHPTPIIPGSQACYYLNYAKFQEVDGVIEVDNKAYYGPFLGSQLPNFTELRAFAKSKESTLDFATTFDYVTCSMLKTQSRLNSADVQTGCSHRLFYDPNSATQLVIVSCCCRGQNDPNCKEVTEAAKTKKILCLKGDIDSQTGFYFATECTYTTVKNFKRIPQSDDTLSSFEHQKALALKSPEITFGRKCESGLINATTCNRTFVHVSENGCCRRKNFCDLHHGLRSIVQRCGSYYGKDQKKEGCYIIFYRANNQWYQSSAVWFNMKETKLIHLYSSRLPGTDITYSVSLGFMFESKVDSSCSDPKEQYVHEYFVINCRPRQCDREFNKQFFIDLDEKVVTNALNSTLIPRCENGSWSVTTDALSKEPLVPKPVTTRVVGQYCILRIAIEYIDDKKVISMEFGPVFPTPKDCNTHHKEVDGHFNLTCCYEASPNTSNVNPNCHYSTILSIVDALEQKDDDSEGSIPQDNVKAPASIRQRIHENADYCESSGALGYHGRPSRRCTPGNKGCFHVNGLENAKEAVIASCIGRGEELIASSQDSFDRYHEALICLTEEAKGQCHAVHDGIRWTKVCCCEVSIVRKHVARCKEDSNVLFNENEYVVKRVKEFKDDDDDDKKE